MPNYYLEQSAFFARKDYEKMKKRHEKELKEMEQKVLQLEKEVRDARALVEIAEKNKCAFERFPMGGA